MTITNTLKLSIWQETLKARMHLGSGTSEQSLQLSLLAFDKVKIAKVKVSSNSI
jgi:hypothetical protein